MPFPKLIKRRKNRRDRERQLQGARRRRAERQARPAQRLAAGEDGFVGPEGRVRGGEERTEAAVRPTHEASLENAFFENAFFEDAFFENAFFENAHFSKMHFSKIL